MGILVGSDGQTDVWTLKTICEMLRKKIKLTGCNSTWNGYDNNQLETETSYLPYMAFLDGE